MHLRLQIPIELQRRVSALKMNRPQLIRVRRMWLKLGERPRSFNKVSAEVPI